jgi:hypothetical protein
MGVSIKLNPKLQYPVIRKEQVYGIGICLLFVICNLELILARPERINILDFVGHNTNYSGFYSQYGTSIIGQGAFSRIVIPT